MQINWINDYMNVRSIRLKEYLKYVLHYKIKFAI